MTNYQAASRRCSHARVVFNLGRLESTLQFLQSMLSVSADTVAAARRARAIQFAVLVAIILAAAVLSSLK